MATDYEGKEVKIGDEVDFKEDYEGSGTVLDIRETKGLIGKTTDFLIGQPDQPNGYRFHIAAYFDHDLYRMVVRTDRVWLND